MKNNRVKSAIDARLSGVVMTKDVQARILEKAKGEKIMKKKLSFSLALAFLLALALIGTALAVMNDIGVLNFGAPYRDEDSYFTLPGAEELVQKDLAELEINGILLKVEEAAYDGRLLQVMLSITDPNAGEGEACSWEEAEAQHSALLQKAGVFFAYEGNGTILADNQAINLRSMAYSPGKQPKQVLCWVDSAMELFNGDNGVYQPSGNTMKLSIQISSAESGKAIGALDFSLDIQNSNGRWALELPQASQVNGRLLTFTDLYFSPINVGVAFDMLIPAASMTPDEKKMSEGELIWHFTYTDAILMNGRDEKLGPEKDSSTGGELLENGDFLLHVSLSFAPSDKYEQVNYLVLDGVKVPIPLLYIPFNA